MVSAALFPNSVPRQAVDFAIDHHSLLQSATTAKELAEVIGRKKFDKYVAYDIRSTFVGRILEAANYVRIEESIVACRDPKDDKFLELAVNGKADYLITGDDDLLTLNPFRGIRILTAREFLDLTLEDED